MNIDPKTIPASYDLLCALVLDFQREMRLSRNEIYVDTMIRKLRKDWVIKQEYLCRGETEDHRWTEFKLRLMCCDHMNLESVFNLLANMDPR